MFSNYSSLFIKIKFRYKNNLIVLLLPAYQKILTDYDWRVNQKLGALILNTYLFSDLEMNHE